MPKRPGPDCSLDIVDIRDYVSHGLGSHESNVQRILGLPHYIPAKSVDGHISAKLLCMEH